MKNILIILLVAAVVLLTLGAVNHSVSADIHFVFGTWHHGSLLWLFVVAAILVLAAGLLAIASTGVQAGRTRQKLERELDETYRRLRAAEGRAVSSAAALPAPVATRAAGATSAPDEAATKPDDAATAPAKAAETRDDAADAPPVDPPASGPV
jgi:hypothetical protein